MGVYCITTYAIYELFLMTNYTASLHEVGSKQSDHTKAYFRSWGGRGAQ